MTIDQQLEFRRLQIIFFSGMQDYPKDTDRLERGFKILEAFIDRLVLNECAKVAGEMNTIRMKDKKGFIN
jgi:hypothetical protein